MCQQCATEPPATADTIAATPVPDVLGWLAYNSPADFMRFVISEFPDAVAEYMNAVNAVEVTAYLHHAATHPTAG